MAYCRWSDCDVYVYEDVNGGWTTHVAGRRNANGKGPPVTGDTAEELVESALAREKWFRENQEYEDLYLPDAGKSFNHATPQECAENLTRLKNLGYDVPQDVIDELVHEQWLMRRMALEREIDESERYDE